MIKENILPILKGKTDEQIQEFLIKIKPIILSEECTIYDYADLFGLKKPQLLNRLGMTKEEIELSKLVIEKKYSNKILSIVRENLVELQELLESTFTKEERYNYIKQNQKYKKYFQPIPEICSIGTLNKITNEPVMYELSGNRKKAIFGKMHENNEYFCYQTYQKIAREMLIENKYSEEIYLDIYNNLSDFDKQLIQTKVDNKPVEKECKIDSLSTKNVPVRETKKTIVETQIKRYQYGSTKREKRVQG